MLGSSILKLVYDIDVRAEDDLRLQAVEKAVHAISVVGNAGSYLGDIHVTRICIKRLTTQFISS